MLREERSRREEAERAGDERRQAMAGLERRRTSTGDPGRTIVFSHTLRNIGNGPDAFTVSARCATGWPVSVYRDANGNGSLDPGDPRVTGTVQLAMGDAAALLVAVNVPGVATVRGVTDSVDVSTSSRFNTAVTDSLQDLLQIRDVGIVVTLDKSVDRATATPGDVLTYSIDYRAIGTETASNLRISDVVPLGSSYVAGTLRLNGAPLSDVSGDDAGSFEAAAHRVVVTLASVSGGDAGTVSFQVRVAP